MEHLDSGKWDNIYVICTDTTRYNYLFLSMNRNNLVQPGLNEKLETNVDTCLVNKSEWFSVPLVEQIKLSLVEAYTHTV